MKKEHIYFLTGIASTTVLGFILFFRGCVPEQNHTTVITDTVFVNKPYKEIVIKEVEKPTTVFVYKTDTVYRTKIEKDTLISSIEFTPKLAKIHTITPKGIPMIKEYPLPEYRSILIDHEGNTQINRKKKRF